MIEVRIYTKGDGSRPFTRWLDALRDVQARFRIKARITRAEGGNTGDCKSMGGGVMEMRIDYGPGYRVYFSRRGAVLVLLLCGGDKRTQQADIRDAQTYLTDWESRGEP